MYTAPGIWAFDKMLSMLVNLITAANLAVIIVDVGYETEQWSVEVQFI